MNTETTQNLGYSTQVPVRDLSGELFVFYAGDVISPRTKARDVNKRGGGIVINHENLLYRGGFVPRCEIVALRDHFHSESAAFIEPAKQDMWEKTYTAIENGVPQTVGMIERGGEMVHDKLLRRPVYPRQTIATITGKGEGVVQMPVSRADVMRVQRFLFPEWDAIQATHNFPPTIAQLREHFVKRKGSVSDESGAVMPEHVVEAECADAAILSCDQYITFQSETLAEKIAKFERYKQKGQPYTFGERADLLFTQLGIQRPDRAAQANASQMSELTAAMKTLADVNIRQAQTAAVDPRIAILEKTVNTLLDKINAAPPVPTVPPAPTSDNAAAKDGAPPVGESAPNQNRKTK